MALIVPNVNSGGTSVSALLEAINQVRRGLRAALDTMERAEPNGRDYVGADWSWKLRGACQQHADRIARVQAVLAEYDQLAEAVADQL